MSLTTPISVQKLQTALHAKAFIAGAAPDDEGESIRVRGPQSFFAPCHVFAPVGRLPPHESGDRGRDAGKNLFCVRYLKLAELQSRGLNDDHFISRTGVPLWDVNLTMIVVKPRLREMNQSQNVLTGFINNGSPKERLRTQQELE